MRRNPGRPHPLFFVAALLVSAPALQASAAPAERPNILFLLSDDQRADAVGAFGNPHIRTPHLDRLVGQGFRFRNAYCMGSTHGAVCQPSRAMLLSGRTLYRVPYDLKGVKTLPEVLRAAGYATFGTGKWHNGKDAFARGFTQGEAVFFGGMSNHLAVPIFDLGSDGQYSVKKEGTKFSSELFADAAVGFLEQLPADRPFFLYVSFTAPHDPRMPPAEFLEPYESTPPPLPVNFLPQHPFHNGWMTGRDEALAAWPRTPEVIRAQLGEYYGMITHMDHQIGRILGALEEAGHGSDTVVVFTSDQGLAVGSHGLLGKQSLYEHSTGSPLVVTGPDVPHGASDALVYLFDLYPTVCDLTGAPVPDAVEGASLVPIWSGRQEQIRDTLFTTYEDIQRAVRDERWKLIRYPKIDHTQLFDLDEDPAELNNLAADPAQAERVARMMGLLAEWQERTGDTAPLTVAEPEPAAIDLTGRARKPDGHQPPEVVRKYFGGGD